VISYFMMTFCSNCSLKTKNHRETSQKSHRENFHE
jgi:hypothetical protein